MPAFGSASFATGGSNAPTGTEPASTANGDGLFALVIHERSANAITAPTGGEWTQLWEGGSPSGASSGFRYWIGWLIRGASAPNLVWGSSGTGSPYWEVHIMRVTGTLDSTAIDASTAGTTASGQTTGPNPPAATAGGSSDLAIAMGVHWNGSGSAGWTAPSGYTLRSNNTAGNDAMFATKTLTASGSEDPGVFTTNQALNGDALNGPTLLIQDAAPAGGSSTPAAIVVPNQAVVISSSYL